MWVIFFTLELGNSDVALNNLENIFRIVDCESLSSGKPIASAALGIQGGVSYRYRGNNISMISARRILQNEGVAVDLWILRTCAIHLGRVRALSFRPIKHDRVRDT